MTNIKILDEVSFAKEFERCCNYYTSLHIATAWCGDPSRNFPYTFLDTDNKKLTIAITMGISFNQSHPESIRYFLDNDIEIKIFKSEIALFHPKIYLFQNSKKVALFTGSSNFTYSGFYTNKELNLLTEGENIGDFANEISKLKEYLYHWHSDKCSFIPTEKWLNNYTEDYEKQRNKEKTNNIPTPSEHEDSIPHSNWLVTANWSVYYKKVVAGLKQQNREEGYTNVLDSAQNSLPLPWKEAYFDNIENRRVIGGMGKYGWLGHVAAAGSFRKFMKNGTPKEKSSAVKAINNICNLTVPLDEKILKYNLEQLVKLGNSIKVWSRIFTIVRPDIFCTVASPSVRDNLSQTLGIPKKNFETPEGYILLLNLVHSCPWFNSPQPVEKSEIKIWERRAAFMDAIFY